MKLSLIYRLYLSPIDLRWCIIENSEALNSFFPIIGYPSNVDPQPKDSNNLLRNQQIEGSFDIKIYNDSWSVLSIAVP